VKLVYKDEEERFSLPIVEQYHGSTGHKGLDQATGLITQQDSTFFPFSCVDAK